MSVNPDGSGVSQRPLQYDFVGSTPVRFVIALIVTVSYEWRI
jgi:hypothetical protein